MLFRSIEIENQLGFNLPPQLDESGEDVHIDPEQEARLAPMLAMAAQRMLQQNQAAAAQQQAMQQAQDPIIQMQQQELAFKEKDLARKALKDQADIKLKNKQIDMDGLKAAAEMKTRIKEDKANRNMDALMTAAELSQQHRIQDRKSTRLNSSH